jgi:large-conductance mechanosensitive channel
MKNKNSFLYFLLEKKDVDGLIIALMISNAIGVFIDDLTTGIIEPIITGVLPSNTDDEQILRVSSIEFKFKFQYILSGLLKLFINVWLVYILVKILYRK